MKSRDVLIVEELSKKIDEQIKLVFTTNEREQRLVTKVDMATFDECLNSRVL